MYQRSNLAGWFDDLLQAGENIASSVFSKAPVVYGGGTTAPPYTTPPMFPPAPGTYYPAQTGMAASYTTPLLIGAVLVGVYLLSRRRGG